MPGYPDLPTYVTAFGKANKTFPHWSTVQQWYDGRCFEAYRQLGACLGGQALDALGTHEGRSR